MNHWLKRKEEREMTSGKSWTYKRDINQAYIDYANDYFYHMGKCIMSDRVHWVEKFIPQPLLPR